MSEALIWHLIRDNNSFLVKREQTSRRGAVQLSKEPGNLMNAHCFKYSGLANNATVDISAANLSITTKDPKVTTQPSKAFKSQEFGYKFPSKVLPTIAGIVSSSRPDLSAAAKVRSLKILKSLKIKNGVPKKVVTKARRVSRRNK